jgi:hypothetical protein
MTSGSTLILPSISPAHSIGKRGFNGHGVIRPFDLLVSGLNPVIATPRSNKTKQTGGRKDSDSSNNLKNRKYSSSSSSRDNTPRNNKNQSNSKNRSTHSKNNNQAIETMFSQLKTTDKKKQQAAELPSISTNVSQLFQTFTQNNENKTKSSRQKQQTASKNLFQAQKAESDSHDRRRGSDQSSQRSNKSKNGKRDHRRNNNGNWSPNNHHYYSSGRNSNSDSNTNERPSRQNNTNTKPQKGCYIRVATLVEANDLKSVDSFAATLNSFNTTKIVHNFGGRNDRVTMSSKIDQNQSISSHHGGSESNVNKIKIVDNCRFAGYAASPDADSLPQPPVAWLDMEVQKSFEVGTYSS